MSQTLAFVRTFYESGNVGYHIGAKVVEADHPEVWLSRRERIGCRFSLGVGEAVYKSRLAGVGKAYKTDIGYRFEFEDNPFLLAFLTFGGEAGRLAGRRGKVGVSQSPLSPSGYNGFLSVFGQVGDYFTRFGIFYHRSDRNLHYEVFAVSSVLFLTPSGLSIFRFKVFLKL